MPNFYSKKFNTIFNRSCASGKSCLVLNLSGKVFNFLPLNRMFDVDLWCLMWTYDNCLYNYVRESSYKPQFIQSFNYEQILDLVKFSVNIIIWLFTGIKIINWIYFHMLNKFASQWWIPLYMVYDLYGVLLNYSY